MMDETFSFGLVGGYVGAGEVVDELFLQSTAGEGTVSTSCSAGGTS